MRKFQSIPLLFAFLISFQLYGQQKLNPVVENFVNEQENRSQLKTLATELLDDIGPRLVGSPQMDLAHDWAVNQFKNWGIDARNEQFGTWKHWERGISHIDMMEPYVKSLEATQLAWSAPTKKPITAEVIAMPVFKSKAEFDAWLPKVKGKVVLMDQKMDFGRPDYQYKEFATDESYERIKEEIKQSEREWAQSIEMTGYNKNTLPEVLENNGAVAVAISYWTKIMGSNRIFGTKTKNIPMIDIGNEDYSQLYRLAERGKKPKIRIDVQSKSNGIAKTYNTIAEIKGKEIPDEYVILSAHLDSWDGGQGATDNGTGTIAMMEALRMIKQYYPNNKRTILVCLWGSEEQGLNGSRAFVNDHPEIIAKTQAVFNFDSGTGRIVRINGSGYEKSYDYISRWLSAAPDYITRGIETTYPGWPSGGGSDHSSFIAAGAPGFMMGSLHWGYFNYTWHTNRDTYDKIVFDDLKYNAILAATMAYMASEDPEFTDRTKRIMPLNKEGNPVEWPEQKDGARNSDKYFEN